MPQIITDPETGLLWDITDLNHPFQVSTPSTGSVAAYVGGEPCVLVASGSVEDMKHDQNIDAAFHAGEKGVISLKLDPVASFAVKANFMLYPNGVGGMLTSLLRSKGVTLWKDCTFENNTLSIYFVTGFAPLVIIGIILAAGVVAAIVIKQVSVHKVNMVTANSAANQQQQVTSQVLETIKNLPADQQIEALKLWSDTISTNQKPKDDNALDFLKAPLIALIVIFGVVLILPAMVRR